MTIWDLINSHSLAFELHFWFIFLFIVLFIVFSNLEFFSFKDLKMTFNRTKEKDEVGFKLVNKIFFKKKIFNLPQEDFNYFFEEGLYEHIYLTPHDFKQLHGIIRFNKENGTVFRDGGLMDDTSYGPGNSIINIEKWSVNWNRQDFWDIDFREIDKIVKKYRKMVSRYEKSIQRKIIQKET